MQGCCDEIGLDKVRSFLNSFGLDWRFCYFKNNFKTFQIATSFNEIKSVNGEDVILELFSDKKICYFKFIITEKFFQKVVYGSNSICGKVVEDFSLDWQNFLNNNFSLTN